MTQSVHKFASHDKTNSSDSKSLSESSQRSKVEVVNEKCEAEKNIPVDNNLPSYQARLGLARVLVKSNATDTSTEIECLYKEVIKMAPSVHDAYIELGEILVKVKPMDAVDVYTKFPFAPGCSFDDAYLYCEIVRILIKEEKFDDSRLGPNMVALGKVMGLSALEKYVTVIESKFKYNALLRQVYAGVNGKSVDDKDLQQFFKFKCWV